MKILDASTLIAILYDLGRPDLFDSLLELEHALAVAGYVAESELRGRETRRVVGRWCGRARCASLRAARLQGCGG